MGGKDGVGKETSCDIGATNRMNGGLSTGGETLAVKGSLSSCLEPNILIFSLVFGLYFILILIKF